MMEEYRMVWGIFQWSPIGRDKEDAQGMMAGESPEE
jgi:hypothetical protein